MVDREDIQRLAASLKGPRSKPAALVTEHELLRLLGATGALLAELEQAEKIAAFHEGDAKMQHDWVHRLEDALAESEARLAKVPALVEALQLCMGDDLRENGCACGSTWTAKCYLHGTTIPAVLAAWDAS